MTWGTLAVTLTHSHRRQLSLVKLTTEAEARCPPLKIDLTIQVELTKVNEFSVSIAMVCFPTQTIAPR